MPLRRQDPLAGGSSSQFGCTQVSTHMPLNPLGLWTTNTSLVFVAIGDGLPVLKSLWMHSQDPPCPWTEDACKQLAEHNRLDILKWLRAQDPPCPWDEI